MRVPGVLGSGLENGGTMKRVWMAAAVAPLTAVVLLAAPGCGSECGTGTELRDGVCENVGGNPDAGGPTRCGTGTMEDEDGNCVAIPGPDGGPDADGVVVTDGGDGAPVCPGPSICGDGLEFDAATCTCVVV